MCVLGGGAFSGGLSLGRDALGSGPRFYLRICPEVPGMGNGWGLIEKKVLPFLKRGGGAENQTLNSFANIHA